MLTYVPGALRARAREDSEVAVLKVFLLLTSPLWGPVLLLRGLARICGDGLLFVLESYRGEGSSALGFLPSFDLIQRAGPVRILFDLVALVLFPVTITAETLCSFLLFLARLPADAIERLHDDGSGSERDGPASDSPGTHEGFERFPVLLRLLFGLCVFVLSPIWLVLLLVGWVVVRLVWGLGVTSLFDRLSGRSRRSARRGRFETFVALRYMRGRKASAGVSVVTGLTILGVALGVSTLVVVLSVMAGFESDLQDKILGANSHVVVLSYDDRIQNWPDVARRVAEVEGVTGVTPFIYSEFMLRSQHARIGAIIKGIDPRTVGEVTDLPDNLKLGPQGRIEGVAEAQALLDGLAAVEPDPEAELTEGRLPGLLIGQEMQAALRVTVGDRVQAVSPLTEPGPMGSLKARIVEYEIRGIFHSGMYEYDTKFSYTNLENAGDLMRMEDGVTGLEVRVDDIYEAPEIAGRIGAKLQYPFWTRDWQKMNEPLFAALKLEKLVMGIILTFIIAVASMNIISTLSMLVIEKRREIAIMKTMGAGRFDVMRLFVVDGLLVGFIGTVIGIVSGVALCLALSRWEFIKLESDVYYVDTLPVDLSWGLVGLVGVLAIGIAFAATIFPSWQASSLDPVEGLRDA